MVRQTSFTALTVVLSALILTQTVLGFDCGTNEKSFLEVGAGLENKNAKEEPTIPAAKLNELIQEHFKDFKYKLPGEGSAFGWNHIDVKSLDLKYRFKFAKKQKNDKIWAVKIDTFQNGTCYYS